MIQRTRIAPVKCWFARDEGGATIEFCIWLPFVLGLLGSAIDASILTTRHALLNSAVDQVVRDLTLGKLGTPTHDELKSEICNRTGVIPNCGEALNIEMQRVSTESFAFREGAVACVDIDEGLVPPFAFEHGDANDLMLMTVCAAVRPMIPVTGLGLALPKISGGSHYALVVHAALVVEPV